MNMNFGLSARRLSRTPDESAERSAAHRVRRQRGCRFWNWVLIPKYDFGLVRLTFTVAPHFQIINYPLAFLRLDGI